jgi:hypothetical protein
MKEEAIARSEYSIEFKEKLIDHAVYQGHPTDTVAKKIWFGKRLYFNQLDYQA